MNYILINSINSLGGAERVLQNVLAEFNHDEYKLVILEKRKLGQYYSGFENLNIITLSEKKYVNLIESFVIIFKFLRSINSDEDKIIGFLWRAYIPISIMLPFISFNKKSFYIMEHLVPEHYSAMFNCLLMYSFKKSSRVFFVSKYALKRFNISNGEVLYNYLDTKTKNASVTTNKLKQIVWVGRYCYQKNINDLISFAKVNEGYMIDVYGFSKDNTEEFPKNISIQGKVNKINYSSYQYLLITSHYESQALVIHEALNYGLSVICREGLYPFIQEFYPRQCLLLYDTNYNWQGSEENINYEWEYNDIAISTWKELLT